MHRVATPRHCVTQRAPSLCCYVLNMCILTNRVQARGLCAARRLTQTARQVPRTYCNNRAHTLHTPTRTLAHPHVRLVCRRAHANTHEHLHIHTDRCIAPPCPDCALPVQGGTPYQRIASRALHCTYTCLPMLHCHGDAALGWTQLTSTHTSRAAWSTRIPAWLANVALAIVARPLRCVYRCLQHFPKTCACKQRLF